jgi:hypothetical protein
MLKNTKQRRKTFTLNTLSWLRNVFKTIRPVYASILLFESGKYSETTKMLRTLAIHVTSQIATRFRL